MDDEAFQGVLRYVTETLQQSEGRALRETERCVLLAAWAGLTYDEIPGACRECQYSPGTLQRDTAPKLWKILKKAWNQKRLTKLTFRSTVEMVMADAARPSSPPSAELNRLPTSGSAPSLSNQSFIDADTTNADTTDTTNQRLPKRQLQGLSYDAQRFCGRRQELVQLQPILSDHPPRLVLLSGPIGAGKTWLLGKLLESVPTHRDILYCRLDQCPSLNDFYQALATFLDLAVPATEPAIDADMTLLNAIIQKLTQRACLILLDQAIALDSPQVSSSQGYRTLLSAIAEHPHRSCVVWSSRQRPSLFVKDHRYLLDMPMLGLSPGEALHWIDHDLGLTGTVQLQQALVSLCSGIPQLIQDAAFEIQRFYNGNIEFFLAPGSISRFVAKLKRSKLLPTLADFTDLAQAILYWLALSPLHRDQLQSRFSAVDPDVFEGILQSLFCRHLIHEADAASPICLGLPLLEPLILERFATQLTAEIRDHRPQLLHSHPICLATATEQVCQKHQRLVVRPIVFKLRQQLGTNPGELKQTLAAVLSELHRCPRHPSYAAGNLLNLAIALNLDLHDWGFDDLSITQADLRQSLGRTVNLARAQLENVKFTPGLRGDLCGAINVTGEMLAIGDGTGGIWVWQYTPQQQLRLINHLSIGGRVQTLTFCPTSNALVVANDQGQVQFYWDVQQTLLPLPTTLTMAPPGRVTCLQMSPDGVYLAAGRQDGAVVLWQSNTGFQIAMLEAHQDSVNQLAFSRSDDRATAHYLISCGDDNRALIWEITPQAQSCQSIDTTTYHAIRAAFCPSQGRILWARYRDQQIHLGSLNQATQDYRLLSHPGDYVLTVAFSANGQYFASSARDKTVYIWDLTQLGTVPLQILTDFEQPIFALTFSVDGRFLLACTRFSVSLWETSSGKQLRQFRSIAMTHATVPEASYHGLNVAQTRGLSEVEKQVLARQGAIV